MQRLEKEPSIRVEGCQLMFPETIKETRHFLAYRPEALDSVGQAHTFVWP